MKGIRWLFIAIGLICIVSGCTTSPSDSNSNSTSNDGINYVEKTLIVGPEMVDCVGVAPQKCYKVKENPDDDWSFFYSQIVDFDYQPGYEYELLVREEKVENPPADGSSLRWTLIKVINRKAVE